MFSSGKSIFYSNLVLIVVSVKDDARDLLEKYSQLLMEQVAEKMSKK